MLTAFVKVLLLLACASINGIASDQYAEKFVNDLNAARAETATEIQIANMHALSWDKKYEADLATIKDTDCKTASGSGGKSSKPEGHIVMLADEDSISDVTEALVKLFFDKKSDTMFNMDLIYSPMHTRIACVPATCTMTVEGTEIPLIGFCILGPHEKLTPEQFKKGTPGSECGSAKSEGGLCVESGKTLKKGDSAKGLKHGGSKGALAKMGEKIKLRVKEEEKGQETEKEKEKEKETKETTTSAAAEPRIALSFIIFVFLAYSTGY